MNDQRRKELQKALDKIAEAKEIIEGAKLDEEESKDRMPESFQEGAKGEKMDTAIEHMDEAITYCDEIVSEINSAME